MAPRSFLLPIGLLLLFSVSLVKSEVATTTTTTTSTSELILDVTASIQSTHEALSLHHQQKHHPDTETELKQAQAQTERETEAQKTQQSYGYMSVPIHSRISLSTPDQHRHKDYRSLTESRLARDSARVNSLLTKLDLKLQGISHADLTEPSSYSFSSQSQSHHQQQKQQYYYYTSAAAANNNNNMNIAAPLTSGSSQGSGEYFARVGVGRPSTPYYLVLDTGSDVSWLQCQPCSSCYQQSDPIFLPSSSSTYSPVPCSSPLCNKLEISACGTRTHTCLYQVSYGDGSFTVGNFVTETLSFGGSTLDRLAMGCGHDNEGLFVASAGLLGLGGGQLSLTSQIKATSFSYCLVDRDSGKSSTLDFNSPRPAAAVTTGLVRNGGVDTFYYVSLTGMTVGGQPLSISPSAFAVSESGGGVIVDSGTAVTRLPTEAYNSLRDAFSKLTQHLPKAEGVALFDTCYDFSSMTQARVPTVGFRFAGGGELGLPAKNYLIPVDSKGTFCFAFAPTSSSMSIIGNVQQQGTRVHFDLAHSAVSFSQNTC